MLHGICCMVQGNHRLKSRSRTPRAFSVTPGSVQGSRPARILSHTCGHRRGVGLCQSGLLRVRWPEVHPPGVWHKTVNVCLSTRLKQSWNVIPERRIKALRSAGCCCPTPTLAAGDPYALTASASLRPCGGGCQALLLTSFAFPVPPNPSPRFCKFCRIDFPPASSPPPSTARPCSGAISSAQRGW